MNVFEKYMLLKFFYKSPDSRYRNRKGDHKNLNQISFLSDYTSTIEEAHIHKDKLLNLNYKNL